MTATRVRGCVVKCEPDCDAASVHLDQRVRRAFVDQFRDARASVLRDAESVDEVLHAIERLGSFLTKLPYGNLGKYQCKLNQLARCSPLASDAPGNSPQLHSPFERLYPIVTEGRNDLMHQGAYARNLATHAVVLCLTLEDALMNGPGSDKLVADYMARHLVIAERWQPVSFARQQMLANSYSCLPLQLPDGTWNWLFDASVARFLGADDKERKRRLLMPIEDAVSLSVHPLKLVATTPFGSQESIAKALPLLSENRPLLIYDERRGICDVIGILTAFDCL